MPDMRGGSVRYVTDSRKLIRLLEQRGWRLVSIEGSHHQFKHPDVRGRLTVPHPRKDISIGVVRAIYRQAGLESK
jgi:predicted RNA binding protein YcfA (HicA-like mRNA interferase family)